MPSHLVEGRPLPNAVAGHVALELCNTKALWGTPAEREYLTDVTALALWAREHSLGASASPRSLRDVRALRAVLYPAITDRGPLDPLHAFVARAVARSTLGPSGLTVPDGPHTLVDRLALATYDLLSTHGLHSITLCSGDPCGWVFLDPAHRRRWCIMAVCGNRAKARRHAARVRVG